MRKALKDCKRIVIKAGTSILTGAEGKISRKNFEQLGEQILSLKKQGREIVLVSSGAISFGMQSVLLKRRPQKIAKLQACAAIGQGKLMHAYEEFFGRQGNPTAQILLTRDGLEQRTRFLAARRTFFELFRMHVIPIVNENDTVSTEEIAFGDNDILSVHVAHLIEADLLIILSDVDGFYLRDGSRVREVHSEKDIENNLIGHLSDKRREVTVGGMKAKLSAAHVAMRLGVPLLLLSGRQAGAILKALEGEDCGTLFRASDAPGARKKWIAFSAARKGALVIDEGAYEALCHKKVSLLPSGITKVSGNFEKGDVVEIQNRKGTVVGRGVVRYPAKALMKITGKKTHEIEALLGYKHHDEVIHRNDLVLWG
ncbi:MAG: glutamate 5-kinase [Candidatus Omnitrophica bacterium]|nr:glutamate 5-kinase [Candidatus Omnitrophota bacterium]